MATWRETFAAAQRALPRNATPAERAEATRRAAALYRGERAPAAHQRRRTNPDRADLKKIAIVAAVAFAAWKLVLGGTVSATGQTTLPAVRQSCGCQTSLP